jgi:PAS domain S-box-containing protein
VLTRVDSSRDAWLVLGTGLALAAVTGVLALTRGRHRQAMPEVERYFALAPEMVVLAGFDGYWKRVNPTVEALLGYTERDWRARPFMEFIHPDDRARSEEEALRVFEGATVHAFENRVLCKDGSYKWIEWTATPVTEGRVIYAVGRDVTERRRSESEQAALQRIATLVAKEAPQADVFGAIAEEIGGLLGTEEVRMLRFDSDSSAVVVGSSGRPDAFPLGSHLQLAGDSVALRVLRTGRPARFDDYRAAAGPDAETARSIGVRAVVGVPVFVERRLWGAISAGSTHDRPLPPDSEARLNEFTKLMATAIANAEARAEVHPLADEQAALRRVATLVAEAATTAEIFSAVTTEVAALFGTELVVVGKFDGDPAELLVVGVGDGTDEPVLGSRWKLDDALTATAVYRTGLAARFDHDSTIADPDVAAIVERLRPVATVAVPIKSRARSGAH